MTDDDTMEEEDVYSASYNHKGTEYDTRAPHWSRTFQNFEISIKNDSPFGSTGHHAKMCFFPRMHVSRRDIPKEDDEGRVFTHAVHCSSCKYIIALENKQ